MSLYGRITAECDMPTCHAERRIDAAELSSNGNVATLLEDEGWFVDGCDDPSLTCPQCLEEQKLERKS